MLYEVKKFRCLKGLRIKPYIVYCVAFFKPLEPIDLLNFSSMRLKTKLIIGLGFLFIVILVFGILSIASINRLKNNADQVLKNNYETLVYNNNMLEALNRLPADTSAWKVFEDNLKLQEANITERGEGPATVELSNSFTAYNLKPGDSLSHNTILKNIQFINHLNQQAIMQKSEMVKNAADNGQYLAYPDLYGAGPRRFYTGD